jgi:uncharacterized protein
MSEPPRDDIVRSVPFELTRDDSDGLTLEGYAATFNDWTEINSWEGHFLERIVPGAFKKSLAERTPVLQFDHGAHNLIGSIPIGVITAAREDERGLFVRARLSDNWMMQPVRDAIRDGAITGMSFRFSVPDKRDEWDETKRPARRSIREAVVKELGPVVFPAYETTTVSVRTQELARQLADATDEVRVELAQVLNFGVREGIETSRSDAAQEGTSDGSEGTSLDRDAATDDAPADEGHPSQLTLSQRRRKADFAREHLSLILGGSNHG